MAKPTLSLDKFQVGAGKQPAPAPPVAEEQPVDETPQAAPAPAPRKAARATAAKSEMKKVNYEVRPEADRQVNLMKVEQERPKKDLVAEALNLLFKKYGKPEVA